MRPKREIVLGVADTGEEGEIVEALRRRTRDVLYVDLASSAHGERMAILRRVDRESCLRTWTAIIVDTNKGDLFASGMTTGGDVYPLCEPVRFS